MSSANSRPSVSGIRDEIRNSLRNAGLVKVDNDVLTKLMTLSESMNLSPEDMGQCWEAYSLTKNVNSLDAHSFPAFRSKLMKEVTDTPMTLADVINDDKNSAIRVTAYNSNHNVSTGVVVTPAHLNNKKRPSSSSSERTASSSSDHRRVSLSPSTPLHSGKLSSTVAETLMKFGDRRGVGDIVVTYNPSSKTTSPTMLIERGTSSIGGNRPRCTISVDKFETNVREPYRHWFTVLEDRALALDIQLQRHMDKLTALYNFGSDQIAALEAIGIPRQETICCIGRICNRAHEGKINATSVELEGSRHMSGGTRVEVDLSYMESNKLSYSLFPGQIVAIEGMNCSGRKLVAQRICEGAPHAPIQSSVAELLKCHHHDNYQAGAPIKIVVASGPFTCSDNLEYEPLVDLISTVIVKSKPDVVILAGPFVDINHKVVASGETLLPTGNGDEKILVPYETVFSEQISGMLEALYLDDDSIQTQFILVPSLDDATEDSVYPQAPFQITTSSQLNIPGAEIVEVGGLGIQSIENANRIPGSPKRVHCVSNPCTFQINEVVFGMSSTDVLFHISSDETNANLDRGTRLSRIAQHLIQQRSYYPLFPASANVNLNLKRMDQWQMPCTPDILILPSKFSPLCCPVLDNSTLVINPGLLIRGNLAGTYAIMDIYPIARDVLDNAGGDDVQLKHNIHDRIYVEVKRI